MNPLPIIFPAQSPRGVEADDRDPDHCGHEGVVSRPRVADPRVADPRVADPRVADPRPDDAPTAHENAEGIEPAGRGPKVYFVTFGCQMNKYDTEAMESALEANGYAFTDCQDDADVILYNTCSVRQHAEDRVFGRVGALRRRKQAEPGLTLGVVGCMAQSHGESLMKRMPHLDLVLGTQMLDELPALLERIRAGGEKIVAIEERAFVTFASKARHGSVTSRAVRARRRSPFQAWLTVMRGCDKRCTFCIVPTTRGPEVSRSVADVVEEARALVDEGVVEITLLGQTIDTYGRDLGDGTSLESATHGSATLGSATHGSATLAGLLHALAPLQARGLARLRFVTSHPSYINETLLHTMADLSDLVCPYLHMPAQSGSDRILRRMKRGYQTEDYIQIVERARSIVPDIAIASDFIVGFCGESEQDFQQTLDLARRCRFSSSYIFKYSVRPGTPAARLADDVPDPVKRERHARLAEVQERISAELNRERIGRVEPVLIEGPSRTRPELLTGRTRANRIVVLEGSQTRGSRTRGPVTLDLSSLLGQEVPVTITEATALSLRGQAEGSKFKVQSEGTRNLEP